MNVIVANENKSLLSSLDIDVIKSIDGVFSVDEIINTFDGFFFNKMFLDITAIKDNTNYSNIQKLSIGLDMSKVILLLTAQLYNNKAFISKLISFGIYNFARDKDSLMYLYRNPNSYKDVANYQILDDNFSDSIGSSENTSSSNLVTAKVIGFRNVTKSAGATTLIYLLKRELSKRHYCVALEVNKNDFGYFHESDMFSVNQSNLQGALDKFGNADIILVDLNGVSFDKCDEIIYLIEPSIIKLNKMVSLNSDIFTKLTDCKIVLNKSLLTEEDIKNFEFESNSSVYFNIPPLNDRIDNGEILNVFLNKLL